MSEGEVVDDLIEVVLDYRIDDEPVTYARKLTQAQLGELIVRLDEMADDNE